MSLSPRKRLKLRDNHSAGWGSGDFLLKEIMWPVWSQTLISDVSCHLLDFLELNFPWTDSHLNLSTSAEKPPSCLDDGISRDEESSTQHEILFPVVNSLHYETCLFSIDHSYLALILRPWVLLYLHQLHHQRICIFQGYIFQPMALSVFFLFFFVKKARLSSWTSSKETPVSV